MVCTTIAPTAMFVAQVRDRLGQKYAGEILTLVGDDVASVGSLHNEARLIPRFSSHLSARYAAVIDQIKCSGIKQVLGLGEGLAPYGLILTEDPEFRYVETDLPELFQVKRALLKKLPYSRNRLFTVELDCLKVADVMRVHAIYLDQDQPVFINLEGVFPYFTYEERAKVCEGMRSVLNRHGGKALVSSVVTKDAYVSPEARAAAAVSFKAIYGATNRDMLELAPETSAEVVNFFANHGLTATRIDYTKYYDDVVRLPEFPTSDEAVMQTLKGMNSYLLKVA